MHLGAVRAVEVRKIWGDEARDFTPWLLKNPGFLAQATGLELELHQAEHSVGNFSVDIIGKVAQTDDVVIVENQLEQSVHRHLGQVLTYAGGTNAKYIIWINTGFREEHLSAIRWLNDNTLDDVRFFAIEISAIQIDDSAPAPQFSVVVQPNQWQRMARANSTNALVGEKGVRQRDFWTKFLEAIRSKHPDWTNARQGLPQNWYSLSAGISGTSFSSFFSKENQLVSAIVFESADSELNRERFAVFEQRREEIEKMFGCELVWDSSENKKSSRIMVLTDSFFDDDNKWEMQINWLLEQQARFRTVFAELRRNLR